MTSFERTVILTVALAAVVLSQHSLARGQTVSTCRDGTRTGELKNLLEDLLTQSQLVRKMLPNATERSGNFNTMKSLTALGEHEQRLKSLITLAGTHNDPELAALQVVFKKLVANTCSLFRENYSVKNCSSIEMLMKLKFIMDTFDIIDNLVL